MSSKISVIIPTYNNAQFIPEAIESVFSQTYPIFEVIVINDGSTDNTNEVLAKHLDKIIYIEQKNGGPAKARNTGLKRATGDYIAFLDADDIWLPHKISEQIQKIEKNPNCVMVYSRHVKFDNATGKDFAAWPENVCSGKIFDNLLLENYILLSTILFKRYILQDVGYFNEQLLTAEDTNLFLRIAKNFEIEGMPQIHVRRRQHNTNISNRYDINVGTLDNLDNIVKIYPEFHPDKYPVMKKAYQIRGISMIRESFYFDEYRKCREICRKLIKQNIRNKMIFKYLILSYLPAKLFALIKKLRLK